jgi:acyl carrier protein
MRRCEPVREAIVVASEESPGDKRLVAYLTVDRDAALTAGELRAFLGGRLPGYMIPSYFVFMEKLPLVANGKIDKRALPPVSAARQAIDQDYVAPRNDLEEDLAKMWREVLGLERIGMYDDFFELGGHSLLAARLVSRIREEFEVDLPLRSIFEATTIDRVAVVILHERTGQIYPNALSEALAEIELLAEP